MPGNVHHRFDDTATSFKSAGEVGANDQSFAKGKKRKRESKEAVEPGDAGRESESAQQRFSIQNGQVANGQNGGSKDVHRDGAKSRLHSKMKPSFSESNPNTGKTHSAPPPVHSQLKERAKALWPIRKTLPIWSHSQEIRQGLRNKDVMLLVGETGSGKSTQVPQILVQEPWCKLRSVPAMIDGSKQTIEVGGSIAITEPRRVAAISLARRVAEEMGTPLGSSSPASKVGYAVRFDNSTSPSTRIKFLTEGMLLQEMLQDPWLRKYSAVTVDEVHERGVNVDLVLGFLRKLTEGKREGRGGVALKVAVMSATADMKRLKDFFEEETEDSGRGHEEKEQAGISAAHDEEDESEWSGISSSDEEVDGNMSQLNGHPALNGGAKRVEKPVLSADTRPTKGNLPDRTKQSAPETEDSDQTKMSCVSTCYIEGRKFPVTIKYAPDPVQDFVDAALRTIFQIHYKEPMPGDILVFLTGQETVESLENLVKEYAAGMGPEVPKILVLPLFAALPQAAQQRVFQPAPPKTRKIILATNIAETSVTVSGVRFVIDCGKAKMKQFRSRIGLDSLLVKPISKSAAIQRKGRAGREAPGQCYRLYTEQSYLELQQSNTPEILRCDLSHAILTMKARGVDDVIGFPFLDHPPREALEKALLQLYQLGALTDTGSISEIGQQMAKLPLTVSLGRVLIAASQPDFDCVAEVIDIISCLSVENVFLNLTSEEKKEEAAIARRELFRREGDHLTLLTTVQAYAAEHADRKAWAEQHYVSHRAMQSVMDVRKQLRSQCQQSGALDFTHNGDSVRPEVSVSILKCFLKGFAMNTARLFPDGSYKTLVGNQTVAIHPSSGLFGKKVEAIMYNEFVFTNRSYARGVSAVQMDWIGDVFGVE